MVPSQMCKLLMLRALKHPQTVLNPSGMLAFELCANKKLDALFTLQDVLFASVFTENGVWFLESVLRLLIYILSEGQTIFVISLVPRL